MFSTPFTFLKQPSAAFDPDAQAFFDAIGASGGTLTDPDKDRVNTLVLNLKSNSLWDDLHAFYPYIGGSAITTSFNLIDPTQYRINWVVPPIFETYGVRGTNTGNNDNGAYGRTGFYPARDFTLNQWGIGAYIQSTIAEASNEHLYMGATDISGVQNHPRIFLGQGSLTLSRMAAGNGSPLIDFTTPANNGQGLWQVTRDGTTTTNAYFNGSNVGSNTETVTMNDDNFDIFVLSASVFQPDNPYRPTRRVMGFQFIDKGMDVTQVSAMKTVGDTYMSGR